MPVIRLLGLFLSLGLFTPAVGSLLLTAEVYDTPGLPGFQTYDLTVSSPQGFINGFSFLHDDGIVGPLHQGGVGDSIEVRLADRLFGPIGDSIDSRWLVSPDDGLQIGASQSESGLGIAYSFLGDNNFLYRNLPIARLTTNDPASVRISGDFDIGLSWNDGTRGGASKQRVDAWLGDVPIVAAPSYEGLPDVPLAVVEQRAAEADRLARVAAEHEAKRSARQARTEAAQAAALARREADRLESERLAELQKQHEIETAFDAIQLPASPAATPAELQSQAEEIIGQISDRLRGLRHLQYLEGSPQADARSEELYRMESRLFVAHGLAYVGGTRSEEIDFPMPEDPLQYLADLITPQATRDAPPEDATSPEEAIAIADPVTTEPATVADTLRKLPESTAVAEVPTEWGSLMQVGPGAIDQTVVDFALVGLIDFQPTDFFTLHNSLSTTVAYRRVGGVDHDASASPFVSTGVIPEPTALWLAVVASVGVGLRRSNFARE